MRPQIHYDWYDASHFVNPEEWDASFYVSLVSELKQEPDSETSLEELIYRGR